MSDFITLSCPSCGASLQITSDLERFACSSCGNQHIVRRAGGTVSLAPVVEQLSKVQYGVDKTAAELAIVRLQSEIRDIKSEYSKEANSNTKYDAILTIIFLLGGIWIIINYPKALVPGIIFLLVEIMGIYLTYSNAKTKRETLNRISNALDAKYRELSHNREVVDK